MTLSTFSPVPGRSKSERIQDTANQEHARLRKCCTPPNRGQINQALHEEEVWHTSLLHRLVKIERNDDSRLVLDAAQGLVCRLTGRCYDILDFSRK